jgi:hypothetical protein
LLKVVAKITKVEFLAKIWRAQLECSNGGVSKFLKYPSTFLGKKKRKKKMTTI